MGAELKIGSVIRFRNRIWRVDPVDDREFWATPLDGRDTRRWQFLRSLEEGDVRPGELPLFRTAAIGAEPAVVDAFQAHDFPLPEKRHEVVRGSEGVPVAEADLLYRNEILVWVQGAPHEQPHVHHRDEDQKRRLKALGYRIVEIWPERLDEGLRDLPQRLDRPDLMQ